MTALLDTLNSLLPWLMFLGIAMAVVHECVKSSRSATAPMGRAEIETSQAVRHG